MQPISQWVAGPRDNIGLVSRVRSGWIWISDVIINWMGEVWHLAESEVAIICEDHHRQSSIERHVKRHSPSSALEVAVLFYARSGLDCNTLQRFSAPVQPLLREAV